MNHYYTIMNSIMNHSFWSYVHFRKPSVMVVSFQLVQMGVTPKIIHLSQIFPKTKTIQILGILKESPIYIYITTVGLLQLSS